MNDSECKPSWAWSHAIMIGKLVNPVLKTKVAAQQSPFRTAAAWRGVHPGKHRDFEFEFELLINSWQIRRKELDTWQQTPGNAEGLYAYRVLRERKPLGS